MAKRRLALSFPADLLSEPVIYIISQQFNLVTNIRRAEIVEDSGWIDLEVEGTDKDIEDGISWAISRGIRVETLSEE